MQKRLVVDNKRIIKELIAKGGTPAVTPKITEDMIVREIKADSHTLHPDTRTPRQVHFRRKLSQDNAEEPLHL